MSFSNFLGDVFDGNFSNALKRIEDWWSGMPSWLKDFVSKAESDAGKLLVTLAETAAQDVIAGGISTTSFVSAGKDVLAKLEAQGYALTMQEVMAALNLAVNAVQQKTPTALPASSDPAPASA